MIRSMTRLAVHQLARRRSLSRLEHDGRVPRSGQIIVVFALCLMTMIAMAGLLIDGGFAFATQRQAQAAADTASMAAADAIAGGGNQTSAAQTISAANGFPNSYTDCGGTPRSNGVIVNWPPSNQSEPQHRNSGFVEVITTRAMRTAFAGAIGLSCWLVSGRAVAAIPTPGATCSLCALTTHKGDGDDNVLTINNTGHTRTDGDIIINGPRIFGCPNPTVSKVCGTAIHLYHNGGNSSDNVTRLSAPTISLSGGWASEPGTNVRADSLAFGCASHPDPTSYTTTANVCIAMPPVTDPLNPAPPGVSLQPPDAFTMAQPKRGVGACPNDSKVRVPAGTVASPIKLSLTGSTAGGPNFIICPGLYPGGFSEVGNFATVHVDMIPGVYLMLGGGFQVQGTASIDGSGGVMIYNSGGDQAYSLPTGPWTGTLPSCTGACQSLTGFVLTGPNSTNIETSVNYVLTLTSGTVPNPTGTATFYDGDDPLPSCEDVSLTPSGTKQATVTCPVTFHEFGSHTITAVYSGDAIYKPRSVNKSTVVNPNANLGIQVVDICTGLACGASAPCTLGGACTVLLHAPLPGAAYAGLLIFQDRTQSIGIRLWPGLGLPDCTGTTWMTDGVPGGPNPGASPPAPCGALGGLSGTVYTPHSRTDPPTGSGAPSVHDATVDFRAEGATSLQIVAGRIALSYDTDVRFLFNPDDLATGGKIRLVE